MRPGRSATSPTPGRPAAGPPGWRCSACGWCATTAPRSPAAGRSLRTLAFPLSFLFLGLGFTGILLGDRRRALHDVIAGTAVIYSWDARAARLRFLSRN